MNILPKKSWHVRTKKNIERVHRDEAEAERVTAEAEFRALRAEQEARMRELRARAGLTNTSGPQGHFSLFDGSQDSQQICNKEHEDEKRKNDADWEQRVGILNKLVRTEDVNRPWYSQATGGLLNLKDSNEDQKHERNNRKSDLVTSIYDPMIAIKDAEQIVRQKRLEQRKQIAERLQPPPMQLELYNYDFYKRCPPPHLCKAPHLLPISAQPIIKDAKNIIQIDEHDSSPEIIKIVRKDHKVSSSSRQSRDRSQKKRSKEMKSHKHKRHRKHKKHKKHRRYRP